MMKRNDKFRSHLWVICLIAGALGLSCAEQQQKIPIRMDENQQASHDLSDADTQIATLGAGCFWCVEAPFLELEGVVSVESGYSGGSVENPTYSEICGGNTGHAEVCQVRFDPNKISYADILGVFWQIHDPTTRNRQGSDVGTQYRSVIFYHNQQQKEIAEKSAKELEASGAWNDPIVTEISPFGSFFKAEDYHQNYYELNKGQPYCSMFIKPKMEKFRKIFGNKLKKKN